MIIKFPQLSNEEIELKLIKDFNSRLLKLDYITMFKNSSKKTQDITNLEDWNLIIKINNEIYSGEKENWKNERSSYL